MKYLIDEKTNGVYWKFVDKISYCPFNGNNFDTQQSSIMEVWESEEEENRIKTLLEDN